MTALTSKVRVVDDFLVRELLNIPTLTSLTGPESSAHPNFNEFCYLYSIVFLRVLFEWQCNMEQEVVIIVNTSHVLGDYLEPKDNIYHLFQTINHILVVTLPVVINSQAFPTLR